MLVVHVVVMVHRADGVEMLVRYLFDTPHKLCVRVINIRTILHEHTIDNIEAIILISGVIELTTMDDVLLRKRTIGTTVFLVISIRPTIVKSVRCLKLGVDLTALHTFEFTVGTAEGEIGVTAVSRESTVMGGQTCCKGLTGVGFVTQVDTDRCPLFPNDIRRGLRQLMRSLVPSLPPA